MSAFDVITWMAEHGHPAYRDKIASLSSRLGLDADLDAEIKAEIKEIRRIAQDRYDDWASDRDD